MFQLQLDDVHSRNLRAFHHREGCRVERSTCRLFPPEEAKPRLHPARISLHATVNFVHGRDSVATSSVYTTFVSQRLPTHSKLGDLARSRLTDTRRTWSPKQTSRPSCPSSSRPVRRDLYMSELADLQMPTRRWIMSNSSGCSLKMRLK